MIYKEKTEEIIIVLLDGTVAVLKTVKKLRVCIKKFRKNENTPKLETE